ncbi:MAG: hypothetical protein M1823_004668 [Watsoniomyces obsoletus]|nr:MAG: hypothetical protein M1823_004668 [Watsoniomyces obsoletus]
MNLDHGRHIFVYCNIRTNQVVYSLTRTLQNNGALEQLPNLGKKTIPAALRKDLWQPMATISFPHPPAGLLAFRKLREYRQLHELAYDVSTVTNKERPGTLLNKKKKGRVLMNQKANSIADMAAVLKQQAALGAATAAAGADVGVAAVERLGPEQANWGRRREPAIGPEGVKGVSIAWRDLYDAAFAESWPSDVVHDVLEYERHTAGLPASETPSPEQTQVAIE